MPIENVSCGRLPELVRHWFYRHGVAGGMVVAVSGGADSVALLRALLELGRHEPLVIAHLNHQLRGAESDADEAFVQELHQQLAAVYGGLRLRRERLDVAAEARGSGDNLEATARRLRYNWLARVAQEEGLRLVATGHTADDQAETVLQRLLRGTGLRGLRGIAPRRALTEQVEVVRPLLMCTRADVLAYLNGQGQDFRADSSNADPRFTRNRLRHELLPLLAAEYNPRIASLLARLAEEAQEAFQLDEARTTALLAEAERPRAGPLLILDAARLATATRHEVRTLFRYVWERERWPADGMTFDHWDRLAAVTLGEITATDLPDGVYARRQGRVVQVGRRS